MARKKTKSTIDSSTPKEITAVTTAVSSSWKILTKKVAKVSLWFFLGAFLGLFFFSSFLFMFYRSSHEGKIYEGIYIDGIDFGGKNPADIRKYFAEKNELIEKSAFILTSDDYTASFSAKQIDFKYDGVLLSKQAQSIGRSGSTLSDMSILLQAYISGIKLPPAYITDDEKINQFITDASKEIDEEPIEGIFNFKSGRVLAFKLSKNGRGVDKEKLKQQILSEIQKLGNSNKSNEIEIDIPIIVKEPKISTEKINNYGIKELIASGTSTFAGSIENRAYNINLAATRINGALVEPGETFSFNKTVGDISSLTGYKQAYVISGGKTILGDGGGVCQVSTTLFRAALNAGLPITERNQHAYRVGYYEQDRGPGIDAAIYTPSVDFKFKNDTGKHILIQAIPDMTNYRLTFELYGTNDNREVIISDPVILSTSPAPEAEYIDDPELPKGEIKQIDFAASGASVYFTRIVKKDGEIIQDNKFSSNFRPWKAVYLRGTKE